MSLDKTINAVALFVFILSLGFCVVAICKWNRMDARTLIAAFGTALGTGLAWWGISQPVTRHLHRKRQRLGLCLKCGYDLRGSNKRCPECGKEFGS